MIGRNKFIENMLERLSEIARDVEEREAVEPDLAIVRELVDQLLEEVQCLEDEN